MEIIKEATVDMRDVESDDALCAPPMEQGLVLHLFELRKLFVDKKMVMFRAHGICMYPCIRQGDILGVESRNVKEIQLGDVVVYRRNNRLFAHRVIGKTAGQVAECLLTRSDNARFGSDEPVSDEDVIGIIVTIERRGICMSPQKQAFKPARKLMHDIIYRLRCGKQYFFKKVVAITCRLQRFKVYHAIARTLLFQHYKKLQFSIQIPLNNKADCRFYRGVTVDDLLKLKEEINNGSIARLRIIATINNKTVACAELTYSLAGRSSVDAWKSVILTKLRYRSTGIEEKVSAYADRLFARISE